MDPSNKNRASKPPAAERDKKISKLMTMMLRHAPEEFGLRLDPEDGSCELSELLAAVRLRTGYEQITEEEIRGVVRRSDKQRFEILEPQDLAEAGAAATAGAEKPGEEKAGQPREAEAREGFDAGDAAPRIRARYGHSFGKLTYPQGTPPETLYHGTHLQALPSIQEHGLLPMGREYVHLSAETHFAALAGRRRGKLAMLRIDTAAASRAGVVFYDAGSGVWLAERVPADVLTAEGAEESDVQRGNRR